MDIKKIRGKLLPAFIIGFWLVMTGLLLTKEVVLKNKISAYEPFFSRNTILSDQWMGIYFNNSPIGFVHTLLEPYNISKGVTGYRIINRTWMNFLLLRKRNKVWFNATAILDDSYQLKRFNFELNSGLHTIEISGEVSGQGVLNVQINSHGTITKKKIILPRQKGIIIANIISPFSSFGKLKVGRHYSLRVFNPFSLELEPLEIKVEDKQTIEFKGEMIETFVVKSNYRGLEQIAWVNSKGEIIKEETGLGWVLLKEEAEDATRMYQNMSKTDTELAEMVSVVSNMVLPADKIKYLKLAVSGIDDDFLLETQRQKVSVDDKFAHKKIIEIQKESVDISKVLPLPISEYALLQQASDFVQSDNAQIRKLAQKIVGKEKNSYLAAQKLNKWVFENIKKVPVVSIPSAMDVLKTKEGDCNEHTVLFSALARSIKIPTKMNVGLAYTDGRFYYHAWPSIYIGKWINIDPTFGQEIADIAHVKFIEGDLTKQLDIIKLLGKIKLEVLEFK